MNSKFKKHFILFSSLCFFSLISCKTRNLGEDSSYTKSAKSFKLTPEEEKILDLYGIRDLYLELQAKKSQEIIERFLYAADTIHQITFGTIQKVGTTDSVALSKGLAQAYQKHRTEFFRVESLLRLYRKIDAYEDFMEPLFTNESKSVLRQKFGIKQTEDRIGKFGEAAMNLKFAQSVDASPEVLAVLNRIAEIRFQELSDIMKSDWLPNSQGRIPYLVRVFDGFKANKNQILTNKDDNNQIEKIFVKELEDFDDKVLDFNNLEEGYHELRRNLRWIPILIVSFDGLILPTLEAGKSGVPEYESTLSLTSVTEGKYFEAVKLMRRPKADKTFPLSLYAAAAYYAEQIGYIKDIWQNYHALAGAYQSTGMSSHQAEEKAKELMLAKGYQFVEYSPSIVHDLATKKPLIVMNFAAHGRALGELVKSKETGIFKKIIKSLEQQK